MVGLSEPVDALMDTGFNGDLMLPKELVQEAGLPYLGDVACMTASGETVSVDVYTGSMRWLGSQMRIRILAGPGSAMLLGMGLLRNARLVMQPSTRTLDIDLPVRG